MYPSLDEIQLFFYVQGKKKADTTTIVQKKTTPPSLTLTQSQQELIRRVIYYCGKLSVSKVSTTTVQNPLGVYLLNFNGIFRRCEFGNYVSFQIISLEMT